MAKMMMSKKAMPHPDKEHMKDKASEVAKRGVEKKEAAAKGKKKGKLPPWLMYDENGKVVPKKKGKK